MGNRGATKERRHDKKIDKQLRKDKHRTAIPKILVLGTTEAGKSTVVKQLRIIHKHTFLPEELANLKEIIIQNIVKNMKILVDHAEKENCDLMTVKVSVESEYQKNLRTTTLSLANSVLSFPIVMD